MQQTAFAQPDIEPAPATLQRARIVLVNVLLTTVALGVYRFWGETRVRRDLWSRTSLLGDAFEYSGIR